MIRKVGRDPVYKWQDLVMSSSHSTIEIVEERIWIK